MRVLHAVTIHQYLLPGSSTGTVPVSGGPSSSNIACFLFPCFHCLVRLELRVLLCPSTFVWAFFSGTRQVPLIGNFVWNWHELRLESPSVFEICTTLVVNKCSATRYYSKVQVNSKEARTAVERWHLLFSFLAGQAPRNLDCYQRKQYCRRNLLQQVKSFLISRQRPCSSRLLTSE